MAFEVSPPNPWTKGAPSFGWLSSTSGSPIARRSDTVLPRGDGHRDPGHQAAGGAIDKAHRAGRAEKSPRPIGGHGIERQSRGDHDPANKGEFEQRERR